MVFKEGNVRDHMSPVRNRQVKTYLMLRPCATTAQNKCFLSGGMARLTLTSRSYVSYSDASINFRTKRPSPPAANAGQLHHNDTQ